jgi:membrane dipeptidase
MWNFPNQIAQTGRPKDGPSLTPWGRGLIRELNRLGIIIDVAHAGRQAFHQALDISEHPILLSHGGAYGAIRRSRHPDWSRDWHGSFADDDMLRGLAQTGGLLGINLFGPLFFVDSSGASDISDNDVADHFQYVAETVGVDVLALGCDYFPNYGGWRALLPGHDATRDHFVLPKERLPRLTALLLARGWREEDIVKVLSGNFLRFCERVLERNEKAP